MIRILLLGFVGLCLLTGCADGRKWLAEVQGVHAIDPCQVSPCPPSLAQKRQP